VGRSARDAGGDHLKAIAYEIYVLGPERKERAAYVIELLGRYKSAGKN
jgi:hypothetical protein